MDDGEIRDRIEELVAEEHELWRREEQSGSLHAEERRRLESLQVTLDRCWDLLRQRRALREFGLDPDRAHLRDSETVERYRQ